MDAREPPKANLELLREQLDTGRLRSARLMVNSLHPTELARLLETLPLKKLDILREIVDPDLEVDVHVEVAEEVRDGLIEGMPT